MKAVVVEQPGGPEVMSVRNIERPTPSPGEVIVAVAAAGVNRPDISQRKGLYPVPPDANPILGLEVAGVVDELGEGVTDFKIGDRVMALVHGGGYAEFCCVDSHQAMRIPKGVDFYQAAAFPESALTVEFNMVMRANLKKGETVLIHGGSSGIGSHAIKRALSLGAIPITTSRGSKKVEYCRQLGAGTAIDASLTDWLPQVMQATEGRGVDVILDMVGGDYLAKNIASLADDGRYALISLQGGRKSEIDLEPVLRRRLVILGSSLRPLPKDRKIELAKRVREDVLPRLETGELLPAIDRIYPLDLVGAAHELLEGGAHFGKIVLSVS